MSRAAELVLAALGPVKPKAEASEEDVEVPPMVGVEQAMSELILAIERKDPQGAARAFHSAFVICESMPHEESEEE